MAKHDDITSFNETAHHPAGLVELDDAALTAIVGGGTCPALGSCTDNTADCPNLESCSGNSGCMGFGTKEK